MLLFQPHWLHSGFCNQPEAKEQNATAVTTEAAPMSPDSTVKRGRLPGKYYGV